MLCEVVSAKHTILYKVVSAKHAILYEVVSAKHAWVSLDKIWMGQMGKLEVKNSSTTFVLTAFISFGLFDMNSSINRKDMYCVRVQRFDRP
jgi:hypothetical protein